MSSLPPLPTESRSRSTRAIKVFIAAMCSLVIVGVVGIFLIIHYVGASGITRPIDNKFGDQHLKTTVALVELHRLRYGRYPQSLRELHFIGEWDRIALNSVRYYTTPDGGKYYIEVEHGWMGKPVLDYPPEFWQSTGYSPMLRPQRE